MYKKKLLFQTSTKTLHIKYISTKVVKQSLICELYLQSPGVAWNICSKPHYF